MPERRKVANLLALAVLGTVVTRAMHPYEMVSVLRARGKDQDMPIKWGSLYRVVENLAKHGFLRVVASQRPSGRPERTVYEITDAGRAELVDWVRDLVANPQPRQSAFKAGLSLLGVLSPDTVVTLLDSRMRAMTEQVTVAEQALAAAASEVPRLFLIESEYDLAVTHAELVWTRRLRDEIADGVLPGLEQWRGFHRTGQVPDELTELAEGGTEKD
jgi:DNA-binding PadR family transcriptional regulator